MIARFADVPHAQSKRIVVGAIDDNMVYPVLVWAHSLHSSASSPPHFVIGFLEGLLTDTHRSRVSRILTHLGVSHEFMELASDSRFIPQGHISPTTFAKFLLADAIRGLNVWIDVDAVATTGWDTIFDLVADSTKRVKLVVAERGGNSESHRGKIKEPSNLLFNAGVLGWPARTRIPWSDELNKVDLVETQEQYLFNSLYKSHLARIPEEYNMLAYRRDHLKDDPAPFIIHYAGAHKPWHLPRRFSRVCMSYRCPWSIWFDAESALMSAVQGSALEREFLYLRHQALTLGTIQKIRAYSGRALLGLLQRMGVLGWIIILLARPVSRWIPRGTHPLH